ncbi:prephenate dehydrogenase [Polynucleobacter sp. 30F-ANTBAC]|jgi:prephenate dehydrogenase|uniref:prephenate dehydrogenase n=1 Tax=Polynucleobacter sp. 30F-ANTBAC TaxID=2689095 RepID=UPI001C0BE955|nr:prephenate dehydrogenase [Polynucleobacter sp. 30F-ANTBAC]MBU3599454.1 prephenate dehydrogenase [Polynucleobacter sp. 30F-ANTBAC]
MSANLETQSTDKPLTLGIVGVGLIGASIGLAHRQAKTFTKILGVGRSQSNLDQALKMGAIDQAVSLEECAKQADIIVVCVPVAQTFSVLHAIEPHIRLNTLITDAGSTKSDVIMAAKTALGDKVAQFVPAHPIAGGAQHGAESAQANLYQGKEVVLCPLQENHPQAVQIIDDFWQATGAMTNRMSSLQHDAVFASISHLPHILSYALMLQVANSEDAAVKLDHAGAGFRDFTRIAASSPEMWRDICMANKAAILKELDNYLSLTQKLRELIAKEEGDALLKAFTRASLERQKWEGR